MINNLTHYFALRQNKRGDNKLPFLCFVARVNGERIRKLTGYKIPFIFWNEKTQSAKAGWKDSNRINQKINAINSAILELLTRSDINNILITPSDIQTVLKNGGKGIDLIEYIKTKTEADKNSHKIRESSAISYLSIASVLKKYRASIPINHVNAKFWEEFKIYMIQSGLKKNTISGRLIIIKSFLSRAEKDGLVACNSLKSTSEKKEKTRRQFLTMDEIENIEQYLFKTSNH